MSVLLYEIDNHIATLTINRPDKHNALSAEVIELFLQHLDAAAADDSVRAVIITGSGEKAFCSGADLSGEVGGAGTNQYAELLKRIVRFPKPTVARVNGYCLAGGMGLMLAADIVVAHSDSQFGTPEVNVGLWPMMIGALIYRNMLPKHAAPMVLLGERFGVKQAYEMGFLSKVVAPSELDAAVQEIAEKLAAKSPSGMRIGKEAFYEMQQMPLEEALDYLSGKLTKISLTEDAKEGMKAFIEKRPPNFTGR